jgi:hypothetical protein
LKFAKLDIYASNSILIWISIFSISMVTITIRKAERKGIQSLCELYIEFHGFHVRAIPDRLRKAALGLYQAMGFHEIQDVLVFRKDYDACSGSPSLDNDTMATSNKGT